MKNNSKYIWISLALLGAFLISMLFWFKAGGFNLKTTPVVTPKVSTLGGAVKLGDGLTAEQGKQVSPAAPPERIFGNEVAKNWRREKGYDKEIRLDPEYASYSLETLEKLANGGDVRAMMMLGKKLLTTPGQGLPATLNMYKKAAVHGSTRAINQIAFLTYADKIAISRRPRTIEEQHAAWLDLLPWYEAAKLRGDRYDLTRIEGELRKSTVTLSAEDWQKIREAGKAIYSELAAERERLGLEPFDNTEPPEVKRMVDIMLRRAPAELLK